MTHIFDPSILRAYDIRGQIDQTLFIDDAYYIGRSFGTLAIRRLGPRAHIAVGRDGRLTSPALAQALIRGLKETGCRVADLGLGPTPMTYFAVHSHELDGGIMITGSHNPVDYNGFKMLLDLKMVLSTCMLDWPKLRRSNLSRGILDVSTECLKPP